MKPFARALSLLCILALLLCSCQNANPGNSGIPTEQPTPTSTAEPTETDPPESTVEPTAEPTPEQTTEPTAEPGFSWDRTNFPRLDGSTSTAPLGTAIASKLLGETPEQVADLIHFSRTTESFRKLMLGDCDLLISAEPAASIWEEKEDLGFEWEMEPFAVDGLVFLVNKNNPIDSLTIDQIRGIYAGEITNWSELGGEDLNIVPFQRNAEAGSQTAMLKLVMKDTSMMEPPKDCRINSMFGLIEAVSSFDGSSAAIGYSVYYYANDMKMADGLKILKVEGVEPTPETIRSGEYPLLNNYYVLIKAGLEDSAPAKHLFQWILSEEGQKLVAGQGYVSVLDVEPEPDDGREQPPDAVWSLSEHYVGGDPVEPMEDCGLLLPYIGAEQIYRDQVSGGYTLNLFGVCNDRGELITAPVYSSVFYQGGCLVLYRQMQRPISYDIPEYENATVVAADGSWVKEMGLCRVDETGLADTPLVVKYPDGTFELLNQAVEPVLSVPGEALEAFWGEGYFDQTVWNTANSGPYMWFVPGFALVECRIGIEETAYDLYVDLSNGSVSEERPEGCPEFSLYPDPLPEVDGYLFYRQVCDFTDGALYYCGHDTGTGDAVVLDEDFQVVWHSDYLDPDTVIGGMVSVHDYHDPYSFSWYDLDSGEYIFRYYIPSNDD